MTRRSLLLSLLPAVLLPAFAQDQSDKPDRCGEYEEAFVEGFGKMLDGQGKQTELLQAIVEQQAKQGESLTVITKVLKEKSCTQCYARNAE